MHSSQENPFASPQTISKIPREIVNDEELVIKNCPYCNASGALPAPYNWWRGRRAPLAVEHVVCKECACEFNGVTGLPYRPAKSPWPFFLLAIGLCTLYALFYIMVLL